MPLASEWNKYFGPEFFRGGAGLAGLFGGDPSKQSMKYLEEIPGRIHPYLDPYMHRGERAGGTLEGEYGNLITNPSAMLNKIGAGYEKSPGFDFALKRALEAGGRASAAGGMAGSPMHQEQNMETATQMANQDYMNYLDRALGLYGAGLSGEEGMYGKGFGASQSMADMIAQMLAAESGLSYAGQASRNSGIGGMIGGLSGAIAHFL